MNSKICSEQGCNREKDLIFVDATLWGIGDYRDYCPDHFELYTLRVKKTRALLTLTNATANISRLTEELNKVAATMPNLARNLNEADTALREKEDEIL